MRYYPVETRNLDDMESAYADFTSLFGYTPEGYTAQNLNTNPRYNPWYLVKIGPIYPTSIIPASSVLPGMMLLIGGLWHCVADRDGPTVLTESDNLISLPEYVTVRSH